MRDGERNKRVSAGIGCSRGVGETRSDLIAGMPTQVVSLNHAGNESRVNHQATRTHAPPASLILASAVFEKSLAFTMIGIRQGAFAKHLEVAGFGDVKNESGILH